MKASEINLEEFLSKSDTQFIIPVYQRNYDWKQSHCEQLLNDIIEVGNNNNPHFIGSIVFIHDGIYTSGVKELIIIDGQQRLTTITLIFIALHRRAKESGDMNLANKINKKFLINEFAEGDHRLKLKPTENNDKELKALINEASVIHNSGYSNILNNFNYFKNRITVNDIDVILRGLQQLMFVEISLDRNYDNAQRIFESLNSTGLDLSQADLIRNYILMGLNIKEQKNMFSKYWEFIESNVKDQTGTKLSDFIRDYLTFKKGDIVNKNDVYSAFKKTFPLSTIDKLEETLTEIKKYSIAYGKLINPSNELDIEIRQQLKNINMLEINTSYPFLMKVYDDYLNSVIDKKSFISVLKFIQTFVFRRSILDLPTNTLNKIFMNLYEKININDYENSLYLNILNRSGKQRIPNDIEIKTALKDKDIYNSKSKNKTYLLENIENYQNREFVQIDGNQDITIEHIFPQQPNPNWKIDLTPEDYEAFSQKYLHTIGNLTLSGNNGKLGNKSFIEKRDMNENSKEQGYKYSRLWLNKLLQDIDTWDVRAYQKRTKLLTARFLEIWALPQVSVPIEQNKEINIFDAEDPTNKQLEYAIFFGRKVSDKNGNLSVSSLYIYVVKQLFAIQPEMFVQTLNEELEITTIADNLRRSQSINDTYYIESNLSSSDKFSRIKLILTTLGLEDELAVKYIDTND